MRSRLYVLWPGWIIDDPAVEHGFDSARAAALQLYTARKRLEVGIVEKANKSANASKMHLPNSTINRLSAWLAAASSGALRTH